MQCAVELFSTSSTFGASRRIFKTSSVSFVNSNSRKHMQLAFGSFQPREVIKMEAISILAVLTFREPVPELPP